MLSHPRFVSKAVTRTQNKVSALCAKTTNNKQQQQEHAHVVLVLLRPVPSHSFSSSSPSSLLLLFLLPQPTMSLSVARAASRPIARLMSSSSAALSSSGLKDRVAELIPEVQVCYFFFF